MLRSPLGYLVRVLLLLLLSSSATFAFSRSQNESPLLRHSAPLTVVGPGTYQDTDTNLVFVTGWEPRNNSVASGGTFKRSQTDNDTATLAVSGATAFYVGIIKNKSSIK
jgi:hypothetical protein